MHIIKNILKGLVKFPVVMLLTLICAPLALLYDAGSNTSKGIDWFDRQFTKIQEW